MAGSGRNPNDATDTGWDPAWPLPADQVALIRQLKLVTATWRDTPGSTENLPINSMTWFVGFAFCIWDGGRLPTEAEWNYAAAGGSEQRYYPWSSPPESTTIDPSYAVYNTSGLAEPLSPAGSRSPRGDGRWGHADLAGNLWEFTRDQIDATFSYVEPCVDCANPQAIDLTMVSWPGDANMFDVWTGKRSNIPPTSPEGDIGVRCARLP
jgi:formylglycine-generating enzyme required for sulfatase activity